MKKAFTLSEMVISLSILILIVTLVLPVMKNTLINAEKPKLKQAYAQVLTVTKYMINNLAAYPTSDGFAYTQTKNIKGLSYGGGSKFADLFKSQLNIIDDNVTYPSALNGRVALFCPADATLANNCTVKANNDNTTCFQTSNNTTYCLPKNTTIAQGFSVANNNLAIIQIYFNEEYTPQKGYYVGISKTGKVSTIDPSIAISADIDCANTDTYNEYNSCKIDDYLSSNQND